MTTCIYKITCTKNSKSYVGCTKNFEVRKKLHLNELQRNDHYNIKLQEDFNIYGEIAFIFEIIEECEQSELRKREQFYIHTIKPEYNLPVAKHWLGKKLTEQTKNKMSESKTGLKHNDSTKEKMRDTALKLNRFQSLKNYIENKPDICYDNLGNVFKTLKEASLFHGISQQTICDILKGRHSKTRKGISFYYLEGQNENKENT